MRKHRGMRAIFLASVAAVPAGAVALPIPAHAQSGERTWSIPRQDLDDALRAFALASGVDVTFDPAIARGRRSSALRGRHSIEEGLRILLQDTGLTARPTPSGGFGVVTSRETPLSGEAEAGSAAADSGSADADIVVVGTNIRGIYPSSSPVQIYDAEAIARTSATTTEQFVERIPQNLGTRTQYAAGRNITTTLASQNNDAVSSVDLRGLGAGTTLTLLNGRRLGASNLGEGADISLIPIGAVERVEVLTDGASAIYGADAVGGVVNFVLRRDFDGLETRASYGGVTEGGLHQRSISQLFGRGWSTGNLIVSYSFHSASPLEVADRDFATAAGPGTLTPEDDRHNVFATLTQQLGDRLTIGATGSIALRDIRNDTTILVSTDPLFHTRNTYESSTIQFFGDVAVDYDITDDLRGSLRASYSNVDVDGFSLSDQFNRVPVVTTRILSDTAHNVLDLTAKLDGTLFDIGAGDVRFSIGGGRLTENYGGQTFGAGLTRQGIGRATYYAFGEVFVPIIGRSQNVPLIDRLELSLAGRYTSYSDTSDPSIGQDFGDAFDPKVGVLWSPLEGLNLRGTYGTSFRAPSLPQLDPNGTTSRILTQVVAGASATVLFTPAGPAAGLQPETARTFTLGFDLKPRRFPGFNLSGTYYSIKYTNRIARAPTGTNLNANPELFPDALYRPTSAAQIEQLIAGSRFTTVLPGVDTTNLAAVAAAVFARPNLWVRDTRLRNLALSEQDGLDISISNRFRISAGDLTFGANFTYILNYRQQASLTSPAVITVGSVGFPADLRGRAYATFSTRNFSATLSLNHVDGYVNPAFANERVDGWTTADLYLSYNFPQATGALSGLRLSLSAQNLTDEDPPFVRFPSFFQQTGFDSTNANPLGRLVVFSITKRW